MSSEQIVQSRFAPTGLSAYVDPDDVQVVGVDFGDAMRDGEAAATLDAVEVTAAQRTGTAGDITFVTTTLDGSTAKALASGWVAGAAYRVAFTVSTDAPFPRTLRRSIIATCEQR
jgi:hypothetical protein